MTRKNQAHSLVGDKIPPHSIETEQAVLGAIIMEPDAITNVSHILTEDMFYNDANKAVFKALKTMNDSSTPIDMLTVIEQLKTTQELDFIGGAYYIAELMSRVALATHIEHHANIIKDKYVKREFIRISALINANAYSDAHDSEDLLSFFTKEIEGIFFRGDQGATLLKDVLNILFDEIKEKQGKHVIVEGFSTKLKSLREIIPVWENGRMIVLAARPGMGKTALALDECITAAKQGKPSLYFSLEMSTKQLIKRMLQNDSEIKRYMFDVNDLTSSQFGVIEEGFSKIYDLKIYIDDASFTLNAIKNRCKIFKKKHNIGAVFIDYLQLIEADANIPREQQVAKISRSIKLLSKEINVPIFLLAQLNRESEQRKTEGFMPKLSDLRESGAIEQDADIVIFPHRACYYDPNEDRSWIIVAKNRDGTLGRAEVRTNETVTSFFDPYDNEKNNF